MMVPAHQLESNNMFTLEYDGDQTSNLYVRRLTRCHFATSPGAVVFIVASKI
jgi:hypothetical protein